MKSRILLLIGLIVLLFVVVSLAGGWSSVVRPPTNNPPVTGIPGGEPVACTMDARMCPDGSYVGRTGPNCEFSACPVVTTPQSSTFETRLGVAGEVLGVRITPNEVLEDSRCPIDVVCIQAGTVRLRTTMDNTGRTIEQIFVLNQPVTTEAHTVELISVMPAPVSTSEKKPGDYRFTFKVTRR